jgi:hypothetical protein
VAARRRSENSSARKLLILLASAAAGFLAPPSQTLDLPDVHALRKRPINKVIHNSGWLVHSFVESSTYPGFRDAGLSIAPNPTSG